MDKHQIETLQGGLDCALYSATSALARIKYAIKRGAPLTWEHEHLLGGIARDFAALVPADEKDKAA